ncbi:ribonuclease Z, mitochondrial [Culicoides brevitarsis]|uniref:ribonuclease Z, mitochondrial n=1 Tax=Culicoides brevitarsis TaxID=469753 RepID=UPI00307B23DD
MNFRSGFLKSSSVVVGAQRFYNNNLINLLKSMPRDVSNIAKLQKQRNKIKEKATKYPPGTVDLQFLCPSSSGPASVYVFTDQSRYLFNCGEGTQRLAHEHRTKLARLDHVFMTRTSWSTIGGLPGLCLTLQDTGVPELVLHGPPGLDEVFRATKRFVVLRDLKVNTIEAATNIVEDYEDIVMTVKHVPLQKKASQDEGQVESAEEEIVAEDQVDYYGYENKTKLKPKLDVSNAVQRLVQRTEYCVTAYVCKLKPKPGTLDLEKCVEKRVPPGPLLGQLKNGFDVKLEDGTIVMSKDVRGPDDPGPKFIFLDIPSEDYMESLIENQSRLLDDSDAIPSVVVHFGPNEIITSPAYVEFISKFPDSTVHLVANGSKSFNGYVAAHRIQFQLNQLDPNIFPVLHEAVKFENTQELDESETLKKKMRLDSPIQKSVDSVSMDKFFNVSTLTSFHLRPLRGLDTECEATISSKDYIKELEVTPGCLDTIANVKSEIHTKVDQSRETKYPKLVFLGTGSCIPNKTRNVSSILVHINSETCILLDCGEGTAAQIYRFYGLTEGREMLKRLKAIYVSHLHADHHLGLIGLLHERQAVMKEDLNPLFLFAPQQISFWLAFYDKRIERIRKTYTLVPNSSMLKSPFVDLESSGISGIQTCFVKHCPHSFGVAIETCSSDAPTKITYSGDTMPCNNLVTLGKDSTILIHEATMEDDLEEEAKYKMHSTVSQAINQGSFMNAKYTILTHFSQRYAKLPRLEFDTLKENVGLAFDNMEVTLDDLPKLHKLYPALKAMFMEHCEDMENKAMKRSLKKQRQASRQASPEKL